MTAINDVVGESRALPPLAGVLSLADPTWAVPARTAVGDVVRAGSGQPFRPPVGLACPPRARLRLAPLEVGPKLLGELRFTTVTARPARGILFGAVFIVCRHAEQNPDERS
jgi:hypothetical protein